ncbi:hypothetical protein MMMIC1C10_18410 [Methanococcus maripaludis]
MKLYILLEARTGKRSVGKACKYNERTCNYTKTSCSTANNSADETSQSRK